MMIPISDGAMAVVLKVAVQSSRKISSENLVGCYKIGLHMVTVSMVWCNIQII